MVDNENVMALGQIPLVAARTGFDSLTSDNWFVGKGDLKVPFNMVEITEMPKFSGFSETHHIFCSTVPLTDDCFWLFEVDCPSVIRASGGYWHLQFDDLLTTGDAYRFAYHKLVQPFKMEKVRLDINYLPQTTASIQAETGKIPGVMITPETRFFQYTTPSELRKELSSDDIDAILMNKRIL